MKKVIFILSLVIISILTSCSDPGTSSQKLSGGEMNLPDELKGLKVYRVSTGELGGYVYVGIIDNGVNSMTYPVGKHMATTIIINKSDNRMIEAKEVLMENDSLIVIRK
jgi:hypothetical protein